MALEDDFDFGPKQRTLSEWADFYRGLGWNVVPASKDKHPVVKWREWRATRIPDTLHARWFGQGGEYERSPFIGTITGTGSDRLVGIDLDLKKDKDGNPLPPEQQTAFMWWADYLASDHGGQDLKTIEQVTGGGGAHKFFRAPPHWSPPTNKTKLGVDIRGEGGFIMLTPSPHQSGKAYIWKPGHEPWRIEILEAPQSLCDAIDNLVEEHGGDRSGYDTEHTEDPKTDKDEWGNDINGRETKMRNRVNHAVLQWYRECPILPPETLWEARARPVYDLYEQTTNTRIPGVPRAEGLEREQRGWTEFMRKWRYKMRQWGTAKFKLDAARPDPSGNGSYQFKPEDFEQPRVDPDTGQPLSLLLTAKEFVDGFSPPAYLIDGILQRGYLWALTARTHHGKTAVALYMAQCVARNEPMHGREVKGGTVLVLVGENPQDVRARLLVLGAAYGFDPATVKMRFIDGVVNLIDKLPAIRAETDKIDDLMLVIVDTAAAYFPGDETNSNAQQGAYARLLRQLTFLRGKPAVLVNCHPVKNAARDNLLPLGGSAFLNEIDGNLTLWEEADKRITLHWQGKFRGPDFDPLDFELKISESARVHDEHGRLMPSIVAVPLARVAAEAGSAALEADENRVLFALFDEPTASQDRLATKCGFVLDGRPNRSKVHRILQTLLSYKFVTSHRRGKYRLTPKGKKEIGHGDDDI